jgi:outer membrane lipoprotein-sorting protein
MQTPRPRWSFDLRSRPARAIVVLAALLIAPLAGRAEDGLDLIQLMQKLAQVKSGEATFTERRQVALLDQPLESSGRLSFQAPDTFVRETLKPRQERIAIIGNTLTLNQGGRTRTMALDSTPDAAVIVEALRGTLTGNRESLEKYFTTRLTGNAQLWLLELVPREARLRGRVLSVRVAGQQGVVREVLVAMPDGDRSVMSIDPMLPVAKATARPASTPP